MISSNFDDVPRHTFDSDSYYSDFRDDSDTFWPEKGNFCANIILIKLDLLERNKNHHGSMTQCTITMLLTCNCPNT
ncbi:hypothetical protein P8452_07267 [Trifolium repens]|nr:hypothetical protein P8452_07267 [Trifolium repens]